MVKSLSSNINIIMAQYIIEPKKTLKKWVKPRINIEKIVNFEYVYCRDPNKINNHSISTPTFGFLNFFASASVNYKKMIFKIIKKLISA